MEPRPTDPIRRANLLLGIVMLILGAFLMVSIGNELEIVVIVSGPILMLFGLGAILVVFTKELPASGTAFGMAAILLGAILFIHDLAFPGIIGTLIHIGSSVTVLALGVLQLLGRLRTLRRKQPSSWDAVGKA